jgi:serine/threonine protein kinase
MSADLNVEQFVDDYRRGVKDRDLLTRYAITAQEMIKIIKKLIQGGQITKEDYFGRTRRIEELETRQEKDFLQSLHHCPVCSHIHPTPFKVCPACGTDITKFKRTAGRQGEAGAAARAARSRAEMTEAVISAPPKSPAAPIARDEVRSELPEPHPEQRKAISDKRAEGCAKLVGLPLEHFSVLPAQVKRIPAAGYGITEIVSADETSANFKAQSGDDVPPLLVRLFDSSLISDDQVDTVLKRVVELQSGAEDPNLLRIIGSGTLDGRGVLVHEFVPSDLQKLIDGEPEGIDQDLLQHLLPQILNAVGYCHLHRSTDGTVRRLPHLYLKPSAFLFDPATRIVKLVDCGLWKTLVEVRGYPKHLSEDPGVDQAALAPEGFVLRGKFVNAFLADIYAVGVVIYGIATGQAPFECSDPQEYGFAHLKKFPVPPRVHRYSIPRWLDSMILRCLEKEPARRWRSATQMELSIGKDLGE